MKNLQTTQNAFLRMLLMAILLQIIFITTASPRKDSNLTLIQLSPPWENTMLVRRNNSQQTERMNIIKLKGEPSASERGVTKSPNTGYSATISPYDNKLVFTKLPTPESTNSTTPVIPKLTASDTSLTPELSTLKNSFQSDSTTVRNPAESESTFTPTSVKPKSRSLPTSEKPESTFPLTSVNPESISSKTSVFPESTFSPTFVNPKSTSSPISVKPILTSIIHSVKPESTFSTSSAKSESTCSTISVTSESTTSTTYVNLESRPCTTPIVVKTTTFTFPVTPNLTSPTTPKLINPDSTTSVKTSIPESITSINPITPGSTTFTFRVKPGSTTSVSSESKAFKIPVSSLTHVYPESILSTTAVTRRMFSVSSITSESTTSTIRSTPKSTTPTSSETSSTVITSKTTFTTAVTQRTTIPPASTESVTPELVTSTNSITPELTTSTSVTPELTTSTNFITPELTTSTSVTPELTTSTNSITPELTTSTNFITPELTTSTTFVTPELTTFTTSTTPELTTSTTSVTPELTTSVIPESRASKTAVTQGLTSVYPTALQLTTFTIILTPESTTSTTAVIPESTTFKTDVTLESTTSTDVTPKLTSYTLPFQLESTQVSLSFGSLGTLSTSLESITSNILASTSYVAKRVKLPLKKPLLSLQTLPRTTSFPSTDGNFLTELPMLKRRKTKLLKQKIKISFLGKLNETEPSTRKFETKTEQINKIFPTVGGKNSSHTMSLMENQHDVNNERNSKIHKPMGRSREKNFKSSFTSKNIMTQGIKLTTGKNVPISEIKVTTESIYNNTLRTNMYKINFGIKRNGTEEVKKAHNKDLSKNTIHYNSKNVDRHHTGTSKSPKVYTTENKNKINHLEEILLKYYEEFKNRNMLVNKKDQKYQNKNVPIKRKLKTNAGPVPYESEENVQSMCFQSVVNRKYLNSSYLSLTYMNREELSKYKSLEFLDLSYNNITRFNISTLSNLNTLKYITLESNNLTDLYPINFNALRNLEYLNLSKNNLSRIRNYTFSLMRSLKYLSLKSNSLHHINATTFRGLQGLLHLDLSSNNIDYLHADFLPKILNLKHINLSKNKITTLAINNLKTVQTVDISYNSIKTFDNITLGNLTNEMKILKANNNLLEHLKENVFKNFSKLLYLDVSNNKLNYISPSTFQHLYNLILLNVSCQNILPIDQRGSTYIIQNNKSNNENYSHVTHEKKVRNKTNANFLKQQKKTNSNQINNYEVEKERNERRNLNQREPPNNLTKNNIFRQKYKNVILEGATIRGMNQTTGNRIMKRTHVVNKKEAKIRNPKNYHRKKHKSNNENDNLTKSKTIPIIDFKLNILASISQRLKQFECINVNLNQVPKVLTHSIQILNLKLNKIRSIQLGDLDDYPLLQVLVLSQNKLKLIETDSLGRLDYLKILLLDNNKLKSVPSSLPENIEILNLNFNIITRIDQQDFFDTINLEKLYLQGNKIESIPSNTFSSLRNLKYLDLSSNPIKTMKSIVLSKLNFINLSNLEKLELNFNDRFPIEDGFSLIGIKLTNSLELCDLLLRDYAFVLTLRQMKYLNCNSTERDHYTLIDITSKRQNNKCENSQNTKRKSKILMTVKSNNIPNRTDVFPSGSSCNIGRKKSKKTDSRTINSNLNVSKSILLNVQKCTICKVDTIYESLFEFSLANMNNYIENIISFGNVSDFTNPSMYSKYLMEEHCLKKKNKTKFKPGSFRKNDVDFSINHSTNMLKSTMDLATKKGKKITSKKANIESSSQNEGIFIITKDNDIPFNTFSISITEDRSQRNSSKLKENYKNTKGFKNIDLEMNDQAVDQENDEKETSSFYTTKQIIEGKEGGKSNAREEENKFSIVRDDKRNVILKLKKKSDNGTDENLTERYGQLTIKDPYSKQNKKESSNKKGSSKKGILLRNDENVTDIMNYNNSVQSSERNDKIVKHSSHGTNEKDQILIKIQNQSIRSKFYEGVKSDFEQTFQNILKISKLNNSESNQQRKVKNNRLHSHKNYTIITHENRNSKNRQINQIRTFLRNYRSKNGKIGKASKKKVNALRYNSTKEVKFEKLLLYSPNLNIHKDTQYEMNTVDTDAEFLDIIDKSENSIDTVHTFESSKYDELVSQKSKENIEHHTGIVIFLLIVVFMIVGAFLALTIQWNTVHHCVSYGDNSQSDDDQNNSNSNFYGLEIEMLDNADIYSIT